MDPADFDSANPLSLLDRDPDAAERKYAALRLKLVKYFEYQGIRNAEDLADETIFRLFRRPEQTFQSFQRAQERHPSFTFDRYAYSVAQYVMKEEWLRTRSKEEGFEPKGGFEPRDASPEEAEQKVLVGELLASLPETERFLLTSYLMDGADVTAAKFGLARGTLSVRISRIIRKLRESGQEQIIRKLRKSGRGR